MRVQATISKHQANNITKHLPVLPSDGFNKSNLFSACLHLKQVKRSAVKENALTITEKHDKNIH